MKKFNENRMMSQAIENEISNKSDQVKDVEISESQTEQNKILGGDNLSSRIEKQLMEKEDGTREKVTATLAIDLTEFGRAMDIDQGLEMGVAGTEKDLKKYEHTGGLHITKGRDYDKIINYIIFLYSQQLKDSKVTDAERDQKIRKFDEALSRIDSLIFVNTRNTDMTAGYILRHEKMHGEVEKLSHTQLREVMDMLPGDVKSKKITETKKRWNFEENPWIDYQAMREYLTESIAAYGRSDTPDGYKSYYLTPEMATKLKEFGIEFRGPQNSIVESGEWADLESRYFYASDIKESFVSNREKIEGEKYDVSQRLWKIYKKYEGLFTGAFNNALKDKQDFREKALSRGMALEEIESIIADLEFVEDAKKRIEDLSEPHIAAIKEVGAIQNELHKLRIQKVKNIGKKINEVGFDNISKEEKDFYLANSKYLR